ncbi:MAG TPA: tetratricopeptide repeat protein [Bryobacteraceae bacterium]|nr:tetratricopeptide repeat protein [Bryobacteraceae bacterium]
MTALKTTFVLALAALTVRADTLEDARNRQDRGFLERAVREAKNAAQKNSNDATAQYRLAQAQSFLAEVDLELKDKEAARVAAEAGIEAAERAVELQPKVAEHHRLLGTLCGQVVPAYALLAFKYGRCARASIDRAIELDPRSSRAYLSRGVGNYYLPAGLGGGPELAVRDFKKAIELDPKAAEAHLWLGIALRKLNRNAEARKEIAKSLELSPKRIWAKQQLDKTPAK